MDGISIINHPFWGTPIYGNPYIEDLQVEAHRSPDPKVPDSDFWASPKKEKELQDEAPQFWFGLSIYIYTYIQR